VLLLFFLVFLSHGKHCTLFSNRFIYISQEFLCLLSGSRILLLEVYWTYLIS
jgi:hypothetical protein